LVRVLEDTKEHVDEVDENICNQHSLPEIPWVAHLSEEIEEKHGSAIRVDDAVDSLERAKEAHTTRSVTVRRRSSEFSDRDVAIDCSVREVNFTKGNVCSGAERAEHSRVIGFGVGSNTDSDERNQDGCQDREVGEPSKTLQSADLSENHAQEGDDEKANNEAESVTMFSTLANGNLRSFASFTENKHGHQHDHLKRL
jgi:hypothetical protein